MIFKNISLKNYNTFGLDYNADCLISVKTEDEAASIFKNDISLEDRLFIIGEGSNLLFTKDFKGTIIHPEISGIEVVEKDNEKVLIAAGAGVRWDNLVAWSVSNNFYGLENLSLIPGSVGATPVQNIGAYGVEIKDSLQNVRAVNLRDGSVREFSNQECEFGYRDSIFKRELKGQYLITRVFFTLAIQPAFNISYGTLKEETEKLGELSLNTVRQAVINTRKIKLPDPALTGNAGSFFKNPVISDSAMDAIKQKYPATPFFRDNSGYTKIAAGWLIEQCGWKGKRIGDAGVHDKQALVIVNYGNASGEDLLNLSDKIKQSVSEKFGIELEREVEVL